MTRTLRPRKAQPSYVPAALPEETDQNDAGPSSHALQLPSEDRIDDENDFGLGEQGLSCKPRGEPTFRTGIRRRGGKPKCKKISKHEANPKGKSRAISNAKPTTSHTLPKTPKRQMYVLPTPSVNHRHRAIPIYARPGQSERMVSEPTRFDPLSVKLTNGFAHNPTVTNHVNKSWGYNVGSGPLWEMVEDRSWYKEALGAGPDVDNESGRRPRVHANTPVLDGWEVLDEMRAAPYLPTDSVTTDEGNLKPPPAVKCFFGPHDNQTLVELNMFQSLSLSEYIPESTSLIFNAGASVWGLDWCPIHAADRHARSYKQYLAVAPFSSSIHSPVIGVRISRPSHACVQIWSLGPSQNTPSAAQGDGADVGHMRCEMVLCMDGGVAHEIRWCPLPSHDGNLAQQMPRKLGLLAGTFEDGSFSIYVVPDGYICLHFIVKLPQPLIRIELDETTCWSFDWANSEMVAIGTTNGIIAVYDLGPTLKDLGPPTGMPITDLLPTHYLTVHQTAIRALCWIKAPPVGPSGEPRTNSNPTVIASGGYDGVECMTDIREAHPSVMNRTRDVITTMTFSHYSGGPVTIDHENTVKSYSASPSMLGRGHTLLEPQSPIWSLHASDYHPQLAVGSSDGSVATTNMLRATRRGGSVPFFVHKIYQMDYRRKTGEYRMLDRFLPQEILDRLNASRAADSKKGKSKEAKPPINAGSIWPNEVGVHRVVWNSVNGPASSALLASGTASGLCRVDELWGRWIHDKVPYGGIGNIRGEGDAMDIDSGDSDG
ncbi:hypothetical protein BD779DRAFT_1515063 [Infundibulicybe gibba]|nr:hypothetical protein BD779DRAFT_1515063 [Infundibulicybe gibba]